jgi:fructose-1,6-bisphosphatase/inositol monophosphatase family enzyme
MRLDAREIDWLAALLADAATAEIMPRFRGLDRTEIRRKTSAADLVTEADVNAERLVSARFAERYPSALIVGEEAHEVDRACCGGFPVPSSQ